MNPIHRHTMTAASTLALLAGTASAQTQSLPTLPDGGHTVGYVGNVVQEYMVPGYVGSEWAFVIEGADGGWVERRRNGNRVELREGGEGASMRFNARIGYGTGELRPGGTIRYIIEEEGSSHGFTSTGGPGAGPGRGGGGGGGSAILYLPPGEADWNNAVILGVAGAGGGGYVIGGSTTSADADGGPGQLSTCSTGPTLGCSDGTVTWNCSGLNGTLDGIPPGNNYYDDNVLVPYYMGAGGGTYPIDVSTWRHGFPNGSDPNRPEDSSWGFGAGGDNGPQGPGGGGGYSGGGTWYSGEFDFVGNFVCKGGGGGGGSYINPSYAVQGSEERLWGNRADSGVGEASAANLVLENDEPVGAADLTGGMITAATLDHATVTPVPACDAVGGPELWYRYTNDQTCPQAVTLTAEAFTLGGAPLSTDTVRMNAYTGETPSGGACRGWSHTGVYTDVVQPGETVMIAVYTPAPAGVDPDVNALLSFAAVDAPSVPNVLQPRAILAGVEETEHFCGVPYGPLDFNGCDASLTEGIAAYYEFVNLGACEVDATFTLTSGQLNDLGIFSVENGCAEPTLGVMTERLAPGERMLLQIVSQTGDPVSFRVDTAYAPGQPDCDCDGTPDACDPNNVCIPANDDMANAIELTSAWQDYSAAYATPDGTGSCDLGTVQDIWYTHTATTDGQLLAVAESDLGAGATGQVGITVYTADGGTELGCDLGQEADRFGAATTALALVPMRQGETVLVRLSVPDGATGPLATGRISAAFDLFLVNDTCEHATAIPLAGEGSVATIFYPTYTQNEGSEGFCFETGEDHYDTWYTFTAPADGTATFAHRRAGAPLGGGLELYDACGGTLLACHDGDEPIVEVTMTQGQTVALRALHTEAAFSAINPHILTTFEAGGCSAADLAEPFGALDFFDVSAFLGAYSTQDNTADLAEPFGVWDFFDVSTFLVLFNAGCP